LTTPISLLVCLGNFRCNRWVDQPGKETQDGEKLIDADTRAMILSEQEIDPHEMTDEHGTAGHDSRISRKRSTETARFLHYYERWCGHAESASLEHKMRLSVCERLAPVVRKAIEYNGGIHMFGGTGLSFVHAAFSELLECRSMLQHSYAFAFFDFQSDALLNRRFKKVVFERIQSELELLTEQISGVIARAHIRAAESQIVFLTKITAGKRSEFTHFMMDLFRRDDETDIGKTNLATGGSSGSDDDDSAEDNEVIRRSLDTYYDETYRNNAFNVGNDVDTFDWECAACTFVNTANARACNMCDTNRQA
jgi:Ariadne domain